MIDGIGLGEDELADGYHSVAVIDEAGENGGQGLRRVQGGVVEQHDAARLYLGGHPLADGVRVIVFPVQRVPIGKDLKPLRRKGLRVWRRCALGKNLTCKRGVWRVFQERERSKSRGVARGWVVVERWGRMRYTKNRIDELVADVKRLKSQRTVRREICQNKESSFYVSGQSKMDSAS